MFSHIYSFAWRWLLLLTKMGSLCVTSFSLMALANPLHWVFELLSHFRVQYFFLSLSALLIFMGAKNKAYCLIALLGLGVNIALITPYYLPYTPSPSTAHQPLTSAANRETPGKFQFKLLISNVLKTNTNAEKLIAQIAAENPDIVVLLEFTYRWQQQLAEIKQSYPYSVEQSSNLGAFGIALYSKFPFAKSHIRRWGNFKLPSIEAAFALEAAHFTLIATHPVPPMSQDYFAARNSQLEGIAGYVKSLAGAKLVVGDLNSTMWSSYYQILEAGTGLHNASRGFGIIPTWNTWLKPLMIPIDHCLVSEHFTVKSIRSGKAVDSDHLPLIVHLAI